MTREAMRNSSLSLKRRQYQKSIISLLNIEEAGEVQTIGLNFDWLADAMLVALFD